MPKLSTKQIGFAFLVLALFAPVYLCVGSPAFRPDWLTLRFATVPLSVWVVVGLMGVFVLLTWAFSGAAFGTDATEKDGDQ